MSAPAYVRVTEVRALLEHLADGFEAQADRSRRAADAARRARKTDRWIASASDAEARKDCALALRAAASQAHLLCSHPH